MKTVTSVSGGKTSAKEVSYKKIKTMNFTGELDFGTGGCDSGFCGA